MIYLKEMKIVVMKMNQKLIINRKLKKLERKAEKEKKVKVRKKNKKRKIMPLILIKSFKSMENNRIKLSVHLKVPI